MTPRMEYLSNSIGLKIFIGVSLVLTLGILIFVIIEKKRIAAGTTKDDKDLQMIIANKRTLIGMLIGFVVPIVVIVVQFIIRFGFFSLLQEIGAVFAGGIGAVIGAVLADFKWRRK